MTKRGQKQTTPEQAATILLLWVKYKHTRPVADAVGLSIAQVRRVLWKNQIQTPKGKSGLCSRHHDTIAEMAKLGATCEQIAEEIGSDNTQIGKYIRRHSMERPPYRLHPPGKGRNTKGPNNPMWRGGRTIDKHGYVLLWMPDHPEANNHGQVREHRLVMAAKLGRALQPGEVVDHINGVTGDNRPENLRSFPSNADHLRATLTGVPCPARGRRKTPSPAVSETDAPASRGSRAPKQSSRDTGPPDPSGTAAASTSGHLDPGTRSQTQQWLDGILQRDPKCASQGPRNPHLTRTESPTPST